MTNDAIETLSLRPHFEHDATRSKAEVKGGLELSPGTVDWARLRRFIYATHRVTAHTSGGLSGIVAGLVSSRQKYVSGQHWNTPQTLRKRPLTRQHLRIPSAKRSLRRSSLSSRSLQRSPWIRPQQTKRPFLFPFGRPFASRR